MKRVLVAMSGGVDSSVTAFLLHQQGYDCIGVTMKLYENETVGCSRQKTCCSLDDIEDARSVCARIGIPYHVFNFTADFEHEVIDRFVAAYEQGCTPNPCIDCNRYLKFERLYHRARELGCDYIATGHYARIEQDTETGRWLLKKGPDEGKDQSYVLYSLTQDQLEHTLLPLGGMSKDEVRKIAEEQGFINAHKHDSQDICFVPDGDYAAFLRRQTGKDYPAGNFLNEQGEVIGRHRGIIHYTVGQRRGIGISAPQPLYVTAKSAQDNTVTLAPNNALMASGLLAGGMNLIEQPVLAGPTDVSARIRYHQREEAATVLPAPGGNVYVVFHRPQRAIAPGQAVVLYHGDTVFGGGTILRAILPAELKEAEALLD